MTPAELLRPFGIEYVATKSGKFTTTCPKCDQGYCNVVRTKDGFKWYCHQCQEGGSATYEFAERNDLGSIKAIYDYQDENGKVLFQVCRYDPIGRPKEFRQRRDANHWNIKGVRIVPYRLPEILAALAEGRLLWIVEGEKRRRHALVAKRSGDL
jgi:hypothetical protein